MPYHGFAIKHNSSNSSIGAMFDCCSCGDYFSAYTSPEERLISDGLQLKLKHCEYLIKAVMDTLLDMTCPNTASHATVGSVTTLNRNLAINIDLELSFRLSKSPPWINFQYSNIDELLQATKISYMLYYLSTYLASQGSRRWRAIRIDIASGLINRRGT